MSRPKRISAPDGPALKRGLTIKGNMAKVEIKMRLTEDERDRFDAIKRAGRYPSREACLRALLAANTNGPRDPKAEAIGKLNRTISDVLEGSDRFARPRLPPGIERKVNKLLDALLKDLPR